MRVRTEDKRREIVEIAAQTFEELGYDRASMSLISQRVGGSKATLYGYFRSKEDLLLAVLDYDVGDEAERLMRQFLSQTNLRDGLIWLGDAYLRRRLAPRPIANVRMVSTQPENSGIGKTFYDNVLYPAWQRLANRFEMLMDEGELIRADPWVAAMHWKGLCEWDLFDQRLLGAITEVGPEQAHEISTLAADAFLKIYGTGQNGKKPARAGKK
ncbi:MAG TPA: TetR/AcrR family transcriptional regulator [Allosphingosinicella sp.]|nr:TetR/AcrR family transcriptional regulator [Allosphingosinicella sp.]